MSSSVAHIHSETGWDALTGELPLVVRVMSSPATLEEIADVIGEPDLVKVRRRIAKLVREGVIVQRDDRFEAPARIIESVRQEGLLTSFGLHLMPTVTRLANDPGCGIALQLDLDLDEAAQEALCAGWEKELVDELNELSDRPAPSKRPYTLVVFGTSDVPPQAPPSERLIETLKRCARQRSGKDAKRAMLMSYEAHFGHGVEAEALVRKAAAKVEAKGPGSRYTLVYGFCVNDHRRGGGL